MQIYAQTQDALSIVDSVSSDKEDLLNIIESAKTKILDLAIRGQLVPQDPTDEPASVPVRTNPSREKKNSSSRAKSSETRRNPSSSVVRITLIMRRWLMESCIVLINQLPLELPDGWEWCKSFYDRHNKHWAHISSD